QVLAAALLLGGAAGALGVFLAYRGDETCIGGEELAQQIGLPLFGSVSEIVTRQHRRIRALQRAVLYPTVGVAMATVLLGAAAVLYIDLEHPEALAGLKDRAWSLMTSDGP